MQDFQIRIVDGNAGIDSLSEKWDCITCSGSCSSFYHTRRWCELYMRFLAGKDETVRFISASHCDDIIAILPFIKKHLKKFGLHLTEICSPCNSHIALSDVIFDDAHCRHIATKFIYSLRHESSLKWDILHLPNLLEGCKLDEESGNIPLNICVDTSRVSDCIRCDPQSPHLDKLSTSFKRNLRRLAKRASEMGAVSFHYINDPKALPEALEEFLRIEASGWKGVRGTHSAILLDSKLKAFYREIVNRFSIDGKCQINLIKIGDAYAAGQLCFIFNGLFYLLKIGYNPAFERVAPGNLLLYDLIQRCTDDPKIHTLSFVTGPAWAEKWRPEKLKVYNMYFFNRTMGGYLSYFAMKTICELKAFLNSNRRIPNKIRHIIMRLKMNESLNCHF